MIDIKWNIEQIAIEKENIETNKGLITAIKRMKRSEAISFAIAAGLINSTYAYNSTKSSVIRSLESEIMHSERKIEISDALIKQALAE
jgi:hypothetical protein